MKPSSRKKSFRKSGSKDETPGKEHKKKAKTSNKWKVVSEDSDSGGPSAKSKISKSIKENLKLELKELANDEKFSLCSTEVSLALKWFSAVIYDISKCYKTGKTKCSELSSRTKELTAPSPQNIYDMYQDVQNVVDNCNEALNEFRTCIDEYFINWVQLMKKSVNVYKNKCTKGSSGGEESDEKDSTSEDNTKENPTNNKVEITEDKEKSPCPIVFKDVIVKKIVSSLANVTNRKPVALGSPNSDNGNTTMNGNYANDSDGDSSYGIDPLLVCKPLLRIRNVDELNESCEKKLNNTGKENTSKYVEIVCLDSDESDAEKKINNDSDHSVECLSIRSDSPELRKSPSPLPSVKTTSQQSRQSSLSRDEKSPGPSVENKEGAKTEEKENKESKKGSTKTKIIWTDSSDDEDSDLDLDIKPKASKKASKKKESKSCKKDSNKKKSSSPKTLLSDSEDDLKKLLDFKSLNAPKPKAASSSSSPSSSPLSSPQAKESKQSKPSADKSAGVPDLSTIIGSDLDNSVDEQQSDGKEWELTSVSIPPSATMIAKDILASMATQQDSDSGLSVVLSEDEKKEKKTKKQSKNKDNGSDSSDASENKKKTSKSAWSKDKLLTEKLTDTDTEEEEDKWREAQKRKKQESSKSKKRSKRIKIFTSSEGSSSSSSEEEDKEEKKSSSSEEEPVVKKKRKRRIQRSSSDSDDSGSRGEKITDSGGKGKRKNIRKVLKEENLKQSTKAALKEEEERKKRIQEKQRQYNKMIELAGQECGKLEDLVLDFDEETKKPIVSVDPDLVKKLKPHQAEGIKFMWDSCFETVKDAKKGYGSGCILAHCMGLGKSLQVVTLLHTIMSHKDLQVKTALVVCPFSTVLNWVNEFDKWLSDIGSGCDLNVQHLTKTQASHRPYHLKDWQRNGGVMIMGYNMLRNLIKPASRMKASSKKIFHEALCDPGPDIIICDEGHVLKNESTNLSNAINKIKTKRRIVLTGTPLQNNLIEYHCMVQFVKPNLLGDKKEFKNRFVNPIQNGQFEDSTSYDVRIMKRRAHVLHKMLDGVVQRRDYNILTPYLPTKFEYVINLSLSPTQVNLYEHYLKYLARNGGEGRSTTLFKDWQELSRICTHPRVLMMHSDKNIEKQELEEDSEGSLREFIDDNDEESDSSSSSSVVSISSDTKPNSRKTRNNPGSSSESDIEEVTQQRTEWWASIVSQDEIDDIRLSPKMFLLFTILQKCQEIGDKLLIFSQSLYTLDIIEYFLSKIDEDAQQEERNPFFCGFTGTWHKNIDYFRLDGQANHDSRSSSCRMFNNVENTRGRLFLISTKAGGLGINLTGANRVVLFDASWNPSHDVQSIFRVYRFGQTKPCYIYRFLAKGTMEEKVYERQVAKLSTSLRVIDEQQIDRHFSHNDLTELYTFNPEAGLKTTPMLPKDRMMAELLQAHGDLILSHHQHDSLLENQQDEELNEEERKQAWLDFENEKNAPPPPPPLPYMQQVNMNNQPRAYPQDLFKTLQFTLRKQNPDWSEEQLRFAAINVLQKAYQSMSMAQQGNSILNAQRQILGAVNNQAATQNPVTLPMSNYVNKPGETSVNNGLQNNAAQNKNLLYNFNLPSGSQSATPSTSSNNMTRNPPQRPVITPNETIVLDQ